MHFSEVVATSRGVTESSGRLAKIGRIAELLRRAGPDEIEPVASWLSGAPRQGRVGLGYAAISAIDASPSAESSLTVSDVDRALDALGGLSGSGVARARARQLHELFRRATSDEQDFLRRLLFGELRQGALEGVLIEAIAKAADLPASAIRRAVLLSGELPVAARAALTGGESALNALSVRLMQPVRPMLAASAEDVDTALGELDDPTLEYKLDGARVQIHKSGDVVKVFSRTLNDVTGSVPDIVSVAAALPARDLILDGEVIALNPDGTPRPFQMTMRRFGRTKDVDGLQAELPLTLFAFDALFLDGQSLLDEPLSRRIQALTDAAPAAAVPRVMRPSAAEARAFADAALARGHEGVMAKALGAPYAAGRRGAAWLKIKQARTLDLVVLAAEWGHGRRHGRLSNLHLGARDPIGGGFVMLGKTFKGMTDEMLAWQTEQLLARQVARDGIIVYVRPELVVEVAFNEVQESSVYPGGVTLRFARVKRYRSDKTAADAATIEEVRRLTGSLR